LPSRSVLLVDAQPPPQPEAHRTMPRWSAAVRPSVLVVEDEGLVAMALQRMLGDRGYRVVGPAVTTREAEGLARRYPLDAALLDVNISGTSILPFAEELVLGGTPVVFYTGYGKSDEIRQRFPEARVVSKPAGEGEIVDAVSAALAGAHAGAPV
jgi:DNA-binding NarL/FixJ family response regulator